MSLGKGQRQLEVYRLLQRLKRAKPQDIFKELAPKAGTGADNQAFQRAIHRDLKALQDSYILGVDYFTASGEKIPPGEEEQHANFRLEYYLLGTSLEDQQQASNYVKMGGDAVVHPHIDSSLHFEKDFRRVPSGAEVISIEVVQGSYFHIWFASEDRPVSILLGRSNEQTKEFEFRKQTLEKLDKRAALLLLPHSSLSRFKIEEGSGHCQFDFLREENSYKVKDTGSTFGTYVSELKWEELQKQFELVSDATHGESPFQKSDWIQVEPEMELKKGFRLMAGEIPMAVYRK